MSFTAKQINHKKKIILDAETVCNAKGLFQRKICTLPRRKRNYTFFEWPQNLLQVSEILYDLRFTN